MYLISRFYQGLKITDIRYTLTLQEALEVVGDIISHQSKYLWERTLAKKEPNISVEELFIKTCLSWSDIVVYEIFKDKKPLKINLRKDKKLQDQLITILKERKFLE